MKASRAIAALTMMVLLCAGCSGGPGKSVAGTIAPSSAAVLPSPTATVQRPRYMGPNPFPPIHAQASFAPGLSTAPTNTGASAASARKPANPGLFNEDTFTRYFRFGMGISDVEKEIKALGLIVTYKANEDGEEQMVSAPDGFWRIVTDHAQFDFDKNGRLYEIDVAYWETAKGFVPGESSDVLHRLYGPEDEIECGYFANESGYIYRKKDCYFSVDINDRLAPQTNYEVGWSVFVDIWNDPHILDKGPESNGLMKGGFAGDDVLQFNEENFSREFPLGMDRQKFLDKLDRDRIRIAFEYSTYNDDGKCDCCTISTDHAAFSFDESNKLFRVDAFGWPTAKGLQPGDTAERLQQLYGQADCFLKNAGGSGYDEYNYSVNGYLFSLQFGDYFYQFADALDYWYVYMPNDSSESSDIEEF